VTSFGQTATRWADIHVEQLGTGYWLGRVTVKVPQLPEPHVQENELFHTAEDAIQWAVGIIDLLTRSV
jgi:hypothetical protein